VALEAFSAVRPAAAASTFMKVPVSRPSADATPERRPSLIERVAT
jgi:hypothetical protein